MNKHNHEQGFSLIETLIALTIISIGLVAVYRVLELSTSNTPLLEKKLYAQWLAQNHAAQLALTHEWLNTGESSQTIDYVDYKMTLKRQVTQTPNGRFRKVTITIVDASEQHKTLATLTTYIDR